MNKIRVLEIIGKRPVGGVGTVMLNYQNYIDKEWVQMDYLIFGEQEENFDQEVKKLDSKVYCFPALSGKQMRKTKASLETFFKEHEDEYDIVHLHAPYIAKIVFDVAEKYGIKKRIIHSHATLYAESRIKAIRNHLLWLGSQEKITDRIACSKAAGDFLFGKKDFTVLKNAIECDTYKFNENIRKQIRQSEGIMEEQFVIGHVGRFSKQKNQTYLIDIFAEIKKNEPQAVLWLLGDGETREDIEQKLAEYEFEVEDVAKGNKKKGYDVKLFGMTNSAQPYYQAMDVMIMPSLFEGLPMVGVEAQASGLPCVFSDAITKEVDIVGCTYMSLSKSTQEWAMASISIWNANGTASRNNKNYTEKLDEMGFNIRLEAKRLEGLYQSMVGGKNGAAD